VDWVENESLRLFCPEPADELVWGEAFQGLQSTSEIVGCDEIGEMLFQLLEEWRSGNETDPTEWTAPAVSS
jgi:hypothetical protein